VEFGLWPRRATDEALAAVHAALVAASAAARAVADVDLAALDAAYARRSPRRLDRSGGEDGEDNRSGGEGGGEDALASPATAAAAAFPSLANPLGLFSDDCAAAVDGDDARRPSASAAPATPAAPAAPAAPALLGEELRLRQSALASLQAPPPLSPLPYSWAPPSPRPSPPPTNCAFSAADASAPAAAALAKVSKGLRYIQGALVLV
jgi:hypothetical protein